MALNPNTLVLNTAVNFVNQTEVLSELNDTIDSDTPALKRQKVSDTSSTDRSTHHVRPSCGEKCRNLCHTVIDESSKENINTSFWKLSFSEQRLWFDSHISILKVNSHATAETTHKRTRTLRYTLPVGAEKITVCKTMFMATLGLTSDGKITEFVRKKTQVGSTVQDVIKDGRGKAPNPKKTGSSLD